MKQSLSAMFARATAGLALWVCLNLVCPARGAAQAPDAELPAASPQEMGEKIAESMKTYARGYLEAEYEEDRDTNHLGGENAKPVMVHFPGRFRYASDGNRWRGEYEGVLVRSNSTELRPRGWSGGFDGNVHFYSTHPGDEFVLGEQVSDDGISLPGFFWSSDGEGFPKSLQKNDWRLHGQETIDGYRCYSLVREIADGDKKWKYELTVSSRQGYLPVRYKVIYDGKILWSHELFDLAQAGGGKWYPRRVKRTHANWSGTYVARVNKYEPNREFADAYFRPEIPAGAGVIDYRAGYAYRNDPWWPEVKPMLRERFNWPPIGAGWLQQLTSAVDPSLDRLPAPSLAVQEWIQGGPVDLANLRGKVILLYFSSPSLHFPNPQRTTALKCLDNLYHKFGLEIVEIHTHVEDTSAAKQRMAELEIPWPVAIDAAAAGSPYGKTFAAQKIDTYSATSLIDHDGHARSAPEGKLAELCVELLKGAGAQDVPAVPTGREREPRALPSQLRQAWLQLVNDAPKTAKLVGKVTDDQGAMSGVVVQAALHFELNIGADYTSGTSLLNGPGVVRATVGEVGQFELGNLTKGIYTVSLRAPGRARVERRVVLPENTSSVRLDVDLSQADGLRGRVVDELGLPVAGARVKIRFRHFELPLLNRASTYSAEAVATDELGNFGFENMLTGAYTLDVSHDKFGTGTAEVVPAGTKDVIIRLDPTRPSESDKGPPRGGGRRSGGRGQ